MKPNRITNVNIFTDTLLLSPEEVVQHPRLHTSEVHLQRIYSYRKAVQNILDGQDGRLFVVLGPCSIHDFDIALDYARRLKGLAERVQETLFLIMRVYFEKPRTVVGWKGFINDPFMDDSFQLQEGILRSRELLLHITDMDLPAATEALDPIMPQLFGDLITWTAMGARTTESQTQREMASGLSTPVGFKNGTDGSVEIALNAIRSSASSHRFLGINTDGRCSVFHTRGNPYGHLVLRGGKTPNYDADSVRAYSEKLRTHGLPLNIVVDCSNGNSQKDHRRQPAVFANCIDQVVAGNTSIAGLMLESHIQEGKQDIPADLNDLRYGVSVTDACIDWETTEEAILSAHAKLLPLIQSRAVARSLVMPALA